MRVDRCRKLIHRLFAGEITKEELLAEVEEQMKFDFGQITHRPKGPNERETNDDNNRY